MTCMSVLVDCYSCYCITVRWTLICNSSIITSADVWVSIIVRKQVVNHQPLTILLYLPKKRRWSDVSQILSGQGVDPTSLL